MTPYFKNYLKNTITSSIAGASVGIMSGTAASVAVLKQSVACNVYLVNEREEILGQAAITGIASGLVVGASIGAVLYPMYEWLLKRNACVNRVQENSVSLENAEESKSYDII